MAEYANMPPVIAEFIATAYQGGATVASIAGRLGIGESTIYRMLAAKGIPRNPFRRNAEKRYRSPVQPEIIEEVRQRFKAGETVALISARLHVSQRSVYRWTGRTREKMKPRPTSIPGRKISRFARITDAVRAEIAAEYIREGNVMRIAEKFGVARKTVYNIVCAYRKKNGLPMRHNGKMKLPVPAEKIPAPPLIDDAEHAVWWAKCQQAAEAKKRKLEAAARGEMWAL